MFDSRYSRFVSYLLANVRNKSIALFSHIFFLPRKNRKTFGKIKACPVKRETDTLKEEEEKKRMVKVLGVDYLFLKDHRRYLKRKIASILLFLSPAPFRVNTVNFIVRKMKRTLFMYNFYIVVDDEFDLIEIIFFSSIVTHSIF